MTSLSLRAGLSSGHSSGAGSWALAGVATRAFAGRPQFAGMRPGPLRLVFWLTVAVGDRRANAAGTAVCCLSGASAWPKFRGALAGLTGLAVLAGLWATMNVTWPVWALFVVAGWLYAPMIRTSLAGRGARRALRRSRPDGRTVVVHTVASVEPGAGRLLVETVTTEADCHGWTLTLVAANGRLADYYRQFGFEPTGPAVAMPSREAAVPMGRRARLAGGGGGG